MSNKKWIISGNIYSHNDVPGIEDKLPFGVYDLKYNSFTSEFFLEKISDKFQLPSKIYDSEDDLVNRIKNSFNNFNKNFGVLLKGLKGTGKTVISKQLGNELGLPIICINHNYGQISTFINSINQDLVILFDEFEKVYELHSYRDEEDDDNNENNNKKGISSLLTLMDGVFTSEYKRLFLLTTNKVYMPDALISRPSRIRYVKDFKDLSLSTINLILEDIINDKTLIPGLMEVIKRLEIITIDIVKSIAEEANMYGRSDAEFFEIFNLTRKDTKKELVGYDKEGNKVAWYNVHSNYNMSNVEEGSYLNLYDDNRSYNGLVKSIDESNQFFTLVSRDPKSTFEFRVFIEETERFHQNFSKVSAYAEF